MKKVRWGVMGTADIARGQTIPGMLQADNCELYAVAGRSAEKAEAFCREFGFKKSYGSYEELLKDPQVEAVYIPLPNHLHCEWSIRALEAGKHVLCEKPIAVSEDEARRMFDAAEKNGVFLMEAFAYLHNPFVSAVKAELEGGTVGTLRYMESAFVAGRRPDTDIRLRRETYGGALFDLGCYPVSMILWMTGREPEQVQGVAQFSDRHIDLFTSGLLTFKDGMMATLDCGMLIPARHDRFAVYGEKGSIISDFAFNQPGEITYTVQTAAGREVKTVTARNNYTLEVEQLGRCIRNGETPHVSREFSLMNARVMDRLLKAIEY